MTQVVLRFWSRQSPGPTTGRFPSPNHTPHTPEWRCLTHTQRFIRHGGTVMATHQYALLREEKADARSMLLAAPGRSPEIPQSADAYGWLVGSWELDIRVYWATDVSAHGLRGEAHFGWA